MDIRAITGFKPDSIFELKNNKRVEGKKILNNTSVKVYNNTNKEILIDRVKAIKSLLYNNYYKIELEDSKTIEVSNGIFLKDNKDIFLKDLTSGDSILTTEGYKKIKNIQKIISDKYETFIDFDFQDNTNFLIVNDIFIKNIEPNLLDSNRRGIL